MAMLEEMQAMVTVWQGVCSLKPAARAACCVNVQGRIALYSQYTHTSIQHLFFECLATRPHLSCNVAGLDLLDH